MRTKSLLPVLVIIFVTLGICSCTRKVYVPVQSVKVEYRDKIQKDSIYMLDSVRIVERNDTIFMDRWRTELKYRIQRDSIHVNDTIREPYAVEKIVKVEKQLSWYQNICISGFSFLLASLLGIVAYLLRKKLFAVVKWILAKVL